MLRNKNKKLVLWFKELSAKEVGLVGGKNSSLGEMYRNLTKEGINIPNGFATTAYAYRRFIEESGIGEEIAEILEDLNTKDIRNLVARGRKIRELILKTDVPADIEKEIVVAYRKLCKFYKVKDVDVAVRSSATAEDLPTASFAGQLESYLNIYGEKALLQTVKKCFSSLFTDRAISYRVDKGFNHMEVALSVGVQKMVRSDKAGSGVAFSIDTETGFQDVVLINASYGLGEYIVKGVVTPDEYYVFKPTLSKGFKPIISRSVGTKEKKLIYSTIAKKDQFVKELPVKEEDQNKYVLSEKEILQLAQWVAKIEKHYNKPMDTEWAKDGLDGELYIVQARPETVQSRRDVTVIEEYNLARKGRVLVSGQSVGEKIGQGKVNLIRSIEELDKFKKGQVLVAEMTNPDFEPVMKIAAAIVTNKGGKTSHAAIVSRELGVPCVVGTEEATKVLKGGQKITVSCSEGEEGHVYDGLLPFKVNKTSLKNFTKPKTKIMMNIGEPRQVFNQSFIPNDGVGLAREEFIINNYIKIHPLALFNYDKQKVSGKFIVQIKKDRKRIEEITQAYKDKKQFYIDKLSEGIGRIAAAFYPKDVIVRMADFKSNEYANLIGGWEYEPKEANPMLGWRGASRYYDKKYQKAFELECKAFVKVREEFGLKNVKIMIPFCRTIEEGKKVLRVMEKCGLKRGKDGLEVYVMCEIPSNVILADEFSDIFDGFSIGSNDLTQLALGVDRDSELVSHIYNERNEAVKILVRSVIQIAHRRKKKVGICGQAPSDYPEFARFLVKEGIDSMSLTPDTVIKTSVDIVKTEKKLRRK